MCVTAIVMGKNKSSLDTKVLEDFYGNKLVEVSYIPGISVSKIVSDQRDAYKMLTLEELLSIIKSAGQILATNDILGESVQDYYRKFVLSTGLPMQCVINGLEALSYKMRNIDKILKYEIPYSIIGNFDSGLFKNHDNFLAASQQGKILGVIAPSNHPAVHISWVTALALKYSIVVKPGKDDPFTPSRLANALLISGLPPELVSILPMEHVNATKLATHCDKTIVYGEQKSLEVNSGANIILRGSGNSKVFVDFETENSLDKSVDIVYNSVLHDGGRRCTNASSVIINGNAEEFAYKLAERMSCTLEDPHRITAKVGCFKRKVEAEKIEQFISDNMGDAEDISYKVNRVSRLQLKDNITFLNPTVMLCKKTSPLFGIELPFPFVTVAEVDKDINGLLSNSLAVSLVTKNNDIVNECLKNPTIGKVIINAPTFSENLGDPHDGYLFQHLYRIKSVFGGELIC